MLCTDRSAYDLGKQIEEYDVFLSHDWATSRYLKLFSMMIIFNSRAAFFCSFAVSVLTGFLRAYQLIPDQMWTICFGYVVCTVVLCFWQRLRRLCFRPLIVFVDKLCIAQHDEELKEKGILALAGFLDHSRKLTVLWSTRYFQRLWCAYELAAYSRAEEKPLQVMPVKMSVILGLMSLYWHVLSIAFHVIAWSNFGGTDPVFSRRLMASFFTMLILCMLTPGVCYIGLQLMNDLTQLPQQLKNFRIQESKCFCCTSNHVHPVTGRRMICDRSLVFHTLKKWFGSRADRDLEEGSHLELFNQMIQQELSQSILQTVGSDTAPLSYCIYLVSAGNVPFIAQYIARIAVGLRGETSVLNHCVAAARQLMSWGSLSLLSICAVRVSMVFWKLGLRLSSKSAINSGCVVSVFVSPLIVLTLSLLWLPFQATYAWTSSYSSLPAIPFGIVILVTFYLFAPTMGIAAATSQRGLRQKLSDRYRRSRKKSRRGYGSTASDIFSDPSRGSKEEDSRFGSAEELPSLTPHSRGSKVYIFSHVNSEKSRASNPSRGSKELEFSRQTSQDSQASIETIAVGPVKVHSMGLDSDWIDSGLNQGMGGPMRLESVGVESLHSLHSPTSPQSPSFEPRVLGDVAVFEEC